MLSFQRQQKFFSSYSFYEGLRITAGIIIPVAISLYFSDVRWGVLAGLGALAAGVTDVTGPPHHRLNGMLATAAFLFISVLVTLWLRTIMPLLGIWLVLTSFLFSFIVLYGNRAGQIGGAVLLVIVIMTDQVRQVDNIWLAGTCVAGGALFYMTISLGLHRARPYRLAQQVLGDGILQTAEYFAVKANYYADNANVNALPLQLALAQQQVSEAHERVREVLFKTRNIVKESTHTGRVLLLAFVDTVDLFETMIAVQPNYASMQKELAGTGIAAQMQLLLQNFSVALEKTGLAFQQGKTTDSLPETQPILDNIESQFAAFKKQHDNSRERLSFYIDIRSLLDAFYAIDRRIGLLAFYSSYDKNIDTGRQFDFRQFVLPATVSWQAAISNFSWRSNIMRYAVRMALAVLAGFIVSLVLPLGHDYWLLLTILVILKPAYSITARRNRDRLVGTGAGVVIGYVVLSVVSTNWLLLLIMFAAMVGAFSLMRNRYFLSVLMVTVFVLIAFRLLRAGDLSVLITDRILDTLLGSVIAFLMMWLIPPLWEKEKIGLEASTCLHACKAYLWLAVENVYREGVTPLQYKYLRKQAFVQFANFSGAYQRMSLEPQWLQHQGKQWYQLVVNCNTLIANTAGLASLRRLDYAPAVITGLKAYNAIIENQLQTAVDVLEGKISPADMANSEENQLATDQLHHEAELVFEKRMQELKLGSGKVLYREKLKVLKHLENTMSNLLFITKDIENAAIQLTEQKSSATA